MLKEQFNKAVQEKDWESAKQIQALQNQQTERISKLQELRIKMRQAEAERIKMLAEAEKISRNAKYDSVLLTAIVGAIISLGTFIKSFFN